MDQIGQKCNGKCQCLSRHSLIVDIATDTNDDDDDGDDEKYSD